MRRGRASNLELTMQRSTYTWWWARVLQLQARYGGQSEAGGYILVLVKIRFCDKDAYAWMRRQKDAGAGASETVHVCAHDTPVLRTHGIVRRSFHHHPGRPAPTLNGCEYLLLAACTIYTLLSFFLSYSAQQVYGLAL
jgi:hypothetical protein